MGPPFMVATGECAANRKFPCRYSADWSGWLKPHGGKMVPAPKGYGKAGKYKAIEPAPGRYVKAKA